MDPNTLPQLPVVPPTKAPPRSDLARGATLWLIWGGPIALLVTGPTLGTSLNWASWSVGLTVVVGTLWLGSLCLWNALRCGRAHCWVDGTLLPAWAVVGGLGMLGWGTLPWREFEEVVLGIVLVGFAVECGTGTYLGRRGP